LCARAFAWVGAGAHADLAAWQRYGIAIVTALCAVAFAALDNESLLLLSMLSITLCALIGGLGPALAATAIVIASRPVLAIARLTHDQLPVSRLALLAFAGAVCGMVVAALRAAVRSRKSMPNDAGEDHFSAVFSCVPVPVMIVRLSDGQLVEVNGAFVELSGYTRAQALGRTSAQLQLWVEPEQLIQKLKANRHSDTQELLFLTSNDEVRDVLVSVRLIQFRNAAHLLVTAADVTDRKRARVLEHIANHDSLTNLPNRMLLQNRLQCVTSRAALSGEISAVLCIDLDGFKQVNDSFGHATGDELLQLVSRRLNSRVRAGDTLARVGGDEFVILLERLARHSEAELVAADLLVQMSMPFRLSHEVEVAISGSIGISYFTGNAPDAAAMACKQADAALYAAKRAGRNTVCIFQPGPSSARATRDGASIGAHERAPSQRQHELDTRGRQPNRDSGCIRSGSGGC
jgi:diguanylate cyclase (GGDEF)-like protein/PAS domain S-box-containing protein